MKNKRINKKNINKSYAPQMAAETQEINHSIFINSYFGSILIKSK